MTDVIDLDPYVNAQAQVIMIARASQGDPLRLAAIKEDLRRDETKGWCRVLHMTDEIAVVHWYDQFVLTITDPDTRALIGAPPVPAHSGSKE